MSWTSPSRPWLDDFLAEHRAEFVSFRRHLHAFPELSREEHETTELLAERLRAAGLEPAILPTGTGLTCDIARPIGGRLRTIALRADIDALAMDDTKTVTYRSRMPGRSHSCGHDVHATIVLGAGLALHRVADDLGVSVRLIFEPAEETVPGGSLDVIAAGGLDGVDSIIGFHCDPKLDVGQVGLRVGPLTAATDALEVTLGGPGGHTARPHLTVDLVALAGRVATELPALVARRAAELYEDAELLLVFGSIHSGDAPNVIPSTAVLRGSVRTPDWRVWDDAEPLVVRSLDEIVAGTGATVGIDYTRGIPPVVNSDAETYLIGAAARRVGGEASVVETPRSFGGDTFAWYQEHAPGCLARLGVHRPEWGDERLDLHSGAFDVDERAIEFGIRTLVEAVLGAPAEDETLIEPEASGLL